MEYKELKEHECFVIDNEMPEGEVRITSCDNKGNNNTIIMKSNGDFIINDKVVTNDLEVYEGFKQWLSDAGFPMLKKGESEKVTVIK